MNGVAEWIENSRDIAIDRFVMPPDVRHWKGYIFRESARPVDNLAGAEIGYVGADLDHLTHEFVPDHHGNRDRLPRPFVPFEDVNIGAADAGPLHPDEDIVDADARDIHLFEPQAGFRFALDQRFHMLLKTSR